ncbi:hypothetical protein [Actinacidiphila sp. bgisy160]|uniref:hypothetical protein n=1 Tax=Actinacidiphila sp. bgisy160 TaxID=3413796 RepID=UPI003D728194
MRDALEDNGDLIPAQDALAAVLKAGNGARVQRDLLRRTGDLREVTAACVRITQV